MLHIKYQLYRSTNITEALEDSTVGCREEPTISEMILSRLLLCNVHRNEPVNKGLVFSEIMSKLTIALLRLNRVAVGFIALLERKQVMLSGKGVEILRSLNLPVQLTPEIRATSSLFIIKVNSCVRNQSPKQLKTDNKQPRLVETQTSYTTDTTAS